MAENILITFEVDSKEIKTATDDLVKMGKVTKEDADAFKKINDELAKTKTGVEGIITPVKSLRTQMMEARNEVVRISDATGGKLTPELIKATKRAAELKDRVGDLGKTLDALNPDRKFAAFSQGIQGIAGGFAAAQGAMALFGNESEDVQKALLKVQGALALSQGINSVLELGDAFKNIKTLLVAATISTEALAVANGELAVAEGAATAGAISFSAALTATGIGAIVVAVGLLAAAMYNLSKANDEAALTTELLAKKQENIIANQKLFAEHFKTTLDPLLRSREREIELLEASGDKEKEVFIAKMALIDAELAARRKAIASGMLNDKDLAEMVEGDKDLIAKKEILQIQYSKFLKAEYRERVKAEKAAKIEDNSIGELMKWVDYQKEKTEEAQLAVDERVKIEEDYFKSVSALVKQHEEDDKKRVANAIKLKQDEKDALLQIEMAAINASGELIANYFNNQKILIDQNLNTQLSALQEANQAEVNHKGISERRKAEINARYREKERQIKKKAWEAEKKADQEMILIKTALSIITTFAKLGWPAGIPAAAAAAIEGAAQYAIVASQPTPQFAKGTLSVPGVNKGYDSVHAMLQPGEAVIPVKENQAYATTIAAIYKNTISPADINNYVRMKTSGGNVTTTSQPVNPYDFKYALNGMQMTVKNADYLADKIGKAVKGSDVEAKVLSKRLK
jgi:uncharacterized protein YcbK (DUF882 family)